mgnify:CR=1 FL=1
MLHAQKSALCFDRYNEDDKDDELMSLEGMNISLAMELKQRGITNREELADMSVDELTELVAIEDQAAAEIIMRAREPWFTEKDN